MKLGMIIRPQPEEFAHLKALGLDFAELDLNPVDFFGQPVSETTEKPSFWIAIAKRDMEIISPVFSRTSISRLDG